MRVKIDMEIHSAARRCDNPHARTRELRRPRSYRTRLGAGRQARSRTVPFSDASTTSPLGKRGSWTETAVKPDSSTGRIFIEFEGSLGIGRLRGGCRPVRDAQATGDLQSILGVRHADSAN